MKSKAKKKTGKVVTGILLALFMVLLIFPFYWILITSIKPESELYGAVVTYWPHHISFVAYRNLFESFNFLKYMKNSLIVAVVTTATTLVLSLLAAYAFCRFRFPGRKFLMGLFLCNNMFPTVLLLIPLYAIMRGWGVLYTPTALILAYTTFTLPFCVWLLNGYIKDTPVSLEEAAQMASIHGGAAIPAHVDREGNGVIAVLGDLPESPAFAAVEYRELTNASAYEAQYPRLRGKRKIVSSDAHRLWEIASPGCLLELNCPADAKEQQVRDALIDFLLGK